MVSITEYRLEHAADGRIHVISEEASTCPLCCGNLKVIGIRDRRTICRDGGREIYVIRRLCCKFCRKIHHELPDMIMPYKRHCADTIEKIIGGDVADVCCDFVTEYRIKAWRAAILLYFERVKLSLETKFGVLFPSALTPRKIIRAIVNTNLWVHTRTAMTPI